MHSSKFLLAIWYLGLIFLNKKLKRAKTASQIKIFSKPRGFYMKFQFDQQPVRFILSQNEQQFYACPMQGGSKHPTFPLWTAGQIATVDFITPKANVSIISFISIALK